MLSCTCPDYCVKGLCRKTIYDDPFIRNYIEDLLKNIRTQVSGPKIMRSRVIEHTSLLLSIGVHFLGLLPCA